MRAVDARIPKLVERKILSLPKVSLLQPTGEWPSFVFLSCTMTFRSLRGASRQELQEERYGYSKELQISEAAQDPPSRRDPLKDLVRGFDALLQAGEVFVVEFASAPETSAPTLEDVSLRVQFYVDPVGETVVFSIFPLRSREI